MFIKHKQFMDVCIEVRNILPSAHGGFKLYGCFWNMGQGAGPFCINEEVRVNIADPAAWDMCNQAGPDGSLREGALWEPLKLQA